MTPKFKNGDKVVSTCRTRKGLTCYGSHLTVTEVTCFLDSVYYNTTNSGCFRDDEDALELEDIYKSPLYEALK